MGRIELGDMFPGTGLLEEEPAAEELDEELEHDEDMVKALTKD